jgi:hypothetical protein
MKCKKCEKTIDLSELNTYNFADDINHLAVICSSCNRKNEKIYPIGAASLGGAALFLGIFFSSNYLIFGFIAIVLALLAIVFQLFFSKKK